MKTYRCTYCGCKEVPYDTEICPKCNLQPIPPFKEKPLKLHNVIGGLEEKGSGNVYICIGHNALCNREVEVNGEEMFITLMKARNHLPTLENAVKETWDIAQLKIYFPFEWKYVEAISTALSKGKILKVVE